MVKTRPLGVSFAVLAALFNGTVGVFSVNLFAAGMSPQSVAFFKCVIALVVCAGVLAVTGQVAACLAYLKRKWHWAAVCGFFGFFVLTHFETAAYTTVNVAVVVLCLFGAATVSTFVIEAAVARRFLTAPECAAIGLSIAGLGFLFFADADLARGGLAGLLQAVTAGAGYGVFLVLSKRLRIGAGFIPVFALLLFGSIFLSVPFAFNAGGAPSPEHLLNLALLAILPTIGGFWCTTKALTCIKSQSVQLIELTEPLFAAAFGFFFLAQLVGIRQIIGGAFILLAIGIHERAAKGRFIRRGY